MLRILQRIGLDKTGVLEFFEEARELVAAIADVSVTNLTLLRRLIHTLKGNAMIFGVHTIAALCHALESKVDEYSEPPSATDRAALKACWSELCSSVDALLGASSHGKLEIDEKEHEAILQAVLRGEPREQLAGMIQNLRLEPTERRLMRIAEQAQGMARRLNKGALRVDIEDHALRLAAPGWSSFWSAFVHVVRNAVDHGIESPEERLRAGKPEQPKLVLSTRLESDAFIVELADDGRGIDWRLVAEKALSLGLAHQTQAELVQALFADGLTTKSEATEYSGRGIGMGVIRAACEERGGQVHVHSELNRGTRVEFRFPRAAMQPSQALRAAS